MESQTYNVVFSFTNREDAEAHLATQRAAGIDGVVVNDMGEDVEEADWNAERESV